MDATEKAAVGPALAVRPMGRTRKLTVSALLATLVLGSLASIAQDREYWPISQYPMYAGVWPDQLRRTKVYGITADGEQRLKARDYWDVGNVWLSMVLLRHSRNHLRTNEFEGAVQDLIAEYERRRAAGLHNGPTLYGLRVYQVTWNYMPRAENKDDPDELELVLEVRVAPP